MSKKQSAVASDGKQPLRLNYPQTFRVGLAFATIIVFWCAYDFVVPLLLERAFGLSNSMRGLIMGLDNLLSLFMLPLFGRISDKSKGKIVQKYGKRTPFIVFGVLLAVSLMIFVPLSAQKQLKSSTEIRNGYEAQLSDEAFMEARLSEFYGNSKYCDANYLKINNVTEEQFKAIRYDNKLEVKTGFLGTGDKTYLYDGKEVALEDVFNGKTIKEISQGNTNYKKYVKTGMNTWISEQVEHSVTNSKEGITSLAVYMVILFFVLLAMATFRSPAVALMPDVTPKPLRSQGNAIINLMGGVGGALAFLTYTTVLFNGSIYDFVIIFGVIACLMLILLTLFLCLVKEKKMVEECKQICKDYGIDEEEKANEIENMNDNTEVSESKEKSNNHLKSKAELKFEKKYAHLSEADRKKKLERAKKTSFLLILASIFMWFMGYNAVQSNMSIYCVKALNLSPGVASIISGVSMAVSAIAFIPVGMLAVKIGRRKSIMVGFTLAIISFLLIYTPLIAMAEVDVAKAAVFACFYLIAGFGLIITNVNTFPMVTELSSPETVGRYTGYYYTATMSAQAITPFIAGAIMDNFNKNALFLYAAICIVVAISIMAFVKFGDSVQIPRGKKLSKEEKKQIALEAMDDAD